MEFNLFRILFPNGWGVQQHGEEIRQLFRDRQMDVNNNLKKKSFIEAFADRYINGVRLRCEADEFHRYYPNPWTPNKIDPDIHNELKSPE